MIPALQRDRQMGVLAGERTADASHHRAQNRHGWYSRRNPCGQIRGSSSALSSASHLPQPPWSRTLTAVDGSVDRRGGRLSQGDGKNAGPLLRERARTWKGGSRRHDRMSSDGWKGGQVVY